MINWQEIVIPTITGVFGVIAYMAKRQVELNEESEQIQNKRLEDLELRLTAIENQFARVEERTIHIDRNIERILNRLENV